MSKKATRQSFKSLKEQTKEEKMSIKELEQELENSQSLINKFISEGDYVNAENLSERVNLLSKILKEKKAKETKNRHKTEKENLVSDKNNDIENLNLLWDQKFEELQTRSQAALEELKKNQENELQALYNQYQTENLEFKPSSTYLKLQKEEEALVKIKKFKEAQIVKKKRENQALIDSNKLEQNRENTYHCLEKKIKQKYTNELLYLQKKFQGEFDELTLGKQRELDFLNKKYSAKNSDLIKQQKRENNIINNNNYANRISALKVNNEQKYIYLTKYSTKNEDVSQLCAEIQDNKNQIPEGQNGNVNGGEEINLNEH